MLYKVIETLEEFDQAIADKRQFQLYKVGGWVDWRFPEATQGVAQRITEGQIRYRTTAPEPIDPALLKEFYLAMLTSGHDQMAAMDQAKKAIRIYLKEIS